MEYTQVDLRFLDQTGRMHVVRAHTANGDGWHVTATIDGCAFDKDCLNWQSVERTVGWLRRHSHETPGPNAIATAVRRAVAIIAALALTTSAVTAGGQSQPLAEPPLGAFMSATQQYADMHRRLEQGLGPLHITADPQSIVRAIQALAVTIRAERFDARQGDLFTPALAEYVRARINDALLEHGFTADDVHRGDAVEGIDPVDVHLKVNGTFPWVVGASMMPCLIEALPPLPPELQYRIVGNDLALIDVHASLVVDILPNALAGVTVRNLRPEG